MSWRIFKYALGTEVIELPKGARLLTVQVQHGVPVLWAIVDDTVAPVQRRIHAVYTGPALFESDPGKYLGTVQVDDGSTVVHFFDGGELRPN